MTLVSDESEFGLEDRLGTIEKQRDFLFMVANNHTLSQAVVLASVIDRPELKSGK